MHRAGSVPDRSWCLYPQREWKAARPDLRHLTLIRAAVAKARGDLVLLGPSAAVWLGLPLVGRIPRRVQCLGRRTGSIEHRSSATSGENRARRIGNGQRSLGVQRL